MVLELLFDASKQSILFLKSVDEVIGGSLCQKQMVSMFSSKSCAPIKHLALRPDYYSHSEFLSAMKRCEFPV